MEGAYSTARASRQIYHIEVRTGLSDEIRHGCVLLWFVQRQELIRERSCEPRKCAEIFALFIGQVLALVALKTAGVIHNVRHL